MSPVLVLIFMWAICFSIYHWQLAIKTIISFEISKFLKAVGSAIPYSVVWIDAFLRIFSVSHTGLW